MEIITREQSGLRAPTHRNRITTPTAEGWLHHTAGAGDAGNNGTWWDDVRGIQNFHMAPPPQGRGWSDIAYSFIIGGGQVFEGRGAGIAGGHTRGRNTISHGICLIGNYEWMHPTERDLYAIAWLLRHGRQRGWWGELTGDHSAAPGANTSCCGKNLRRYIPELRATARLGNPITSPPPTVLPPEDDDVKTVTDIINYIDLMFTAAGNGDQKGRLNAVDRVLVPFEAANTQGVKDTLNHIRSQLKL